MGPYPSLDTGSITIDFPSLPDTRNSFILFGNANGQGFFAVVVYEEMTNTAGISSIYPYSETTNPIGISGNKMTINNLRTWGYYYALVPWL